MFVSSSNSQIEYWTEEDPDNSFAVSDRINRHRTSHDITIKPCRCDTLTILRMITIKILRNYLFKIIASEDWRGVRQDYSVGSDTVKFRSVAGALGRAVAVVFSHRQPNVTRNYLDIVLSMPGLTTLPSSSGSPW